MTRRPSVSQAARARSVGLGFAGVGAFAALLGLVIGGAPWLLLTGTAFVVVGLVLAGWSTFTR